MPRDVEVSRLEVHIRVCEERQVRKHVFMEVHPCCRKLEWIKDLWGNQAQAWSLRRQCFWSFFTVVWTLVILTLLTQDTEEAHRDI